MASTAFLENAVKKAWRVECAADIAIPNITSDASPSDKEWQWCYCLRTRGFIIAATDFDHVNTRPPILGLKAGKGLDLIQRCVFSQATLHIVRCIELKRENERRRGNGADSVDYLSEQVQRLWRTIRNGSGIGLIEGGPN